MTDIFDLINNMDDARLIDIIKNYKRYKYDISIKDRALQILKERGIDEEMLRLTGNLTNHKYESIHDVYTSFNNSSKTSFVFFGLFFFTICCVQLLIYYNFSHSILISFLIFSIICYFVCLISIVKALISYSDFYKIIGKHLGVGPYLIFIISGLFVYYIVYFYYKKEMKEELKMIN